MKIPGIRSAFMCLALAALFVSEEPRNIIGAAETASHFSSMVTLERVPNSGIQPQLAVDEKGIVHLIYFGGEPKTGDVFYVRSDDSNHFGKPIRVNSEPGSAIAIGNIRGAHLAVGKDGRVHVAWMGSDKAKPRGKSDSSPMLYARLNDAGTAFEQERNVIRNAVGLDGGGSVAADHAGNVYVTWHAPELGKRGEDNRCVWIACSRDEGKTFDTEMRANPESTGSCGCCGMRAFADKLGTLFVLYRSASEEVHRDMYLLSSTDRGRTFRQLKVDPWAIRACPMSSMSFGQTVQGTLAAWETDGQVFYSLVDANGDKPIHAIAAPRKGQGRKHPVIASNVNGETILAWTEAMGWNRGGTLAWQVFDKTGKPIGDKGHADGVPTWSLVSVFARPDGRFTIMY